MPVIWMTSLLEMYFLLWATTGGQRQKLTPKKGHFGHPKSEWGGLGGSYLQVKPEMESQSRLLGEKASPHTLAWSTRGFCPHLARGALQVVQGMGLCPWVALGSPKSLSATLEKQQKGLGKEEE